MVLLIAQGLLVFVFLMVGVIKNVKSTEELSEKMGWVDDFSPTQVKLIGIYEIVCALAVGLPLFTIISPLSILAGSAGLVVLMLGAAYTHFRRGEMQMIIGNAVLLTLASVVFLGYSD